MHPKIEIVVEDCAGAAIAAHEGADSIELCSNLDHGGLTPAAALMADVCKTVYAINPKTEVNILILNKVDGFYPQSEDVAVLKCGIKDAEKSGAKGVVIGALTMGNRVNELALRELLAVTGTMKTTFHRAFDRVVDQSEDLELLIQLGVNRLLTSGLPGQAADHADEIKCLVDQAAGRILVVAGGGVRAHNLAELARHTGACMLHGSCRSSEVQPNGCKQTDPVQVRNLVNLCRSLNGCAA